MEKYVDFYGQNASIACDGKCHMAWGMSARPRIQIKEAVEEDFVFLSDGEVGPAPHNLTKCNHCGALKPASEEEKLNSPYCINECERRNLLIPDGPEDIAEPYDFSKRVFNIPELHQEVF